VEVVDPLRWKLCLELECIEYVFMAWCSVKEKHRDNFAFTFLLKCVG